MVYIKNWIILTKKEYDAVWRKVNKKFKFKPSIAQFPSYSIPNPFVTYDVSMMTSNLETFNKVNKELEEKFLLAFQEVTQKDEYIYALDWQHDCYCISPYLEVQRDEDGDWIVPVYPNGDYCFFFSKDLKYGYLGDPWEKTITIFGEPLIHAFNNYSPSMFRKVLRKG